MKTVEFERPDGKKLKIEIIRYQPNDLTRNRTPDRHRHNFHAIFFILEGRSVQEIDFESYDLSKNQLMIIPKGSVHWEKELIDLEGYVILFKEDFFSKVQEELLNGFLQYAIALRKLLIPISGMEVETLKLYLTLLEREQEEATNQNQTFILQNLMLAFFNRLEGMIQTLPDKNSFLAIRRPFQRFIKLVEHNYQQQNSLAYYTSELQITPRKLNEITKKLTGKTASNFLIDRIIMEAKRELCFGEKSIKEIAFGLGYESPYYFSRMFKKRTGVSPEHFRAEFAE